MVLRNETNPYSPMSESDHIVYIVRVYGCGIIGITLFTFLWKIYSCYNKSSRVTKERTTWIPPIEYSPYVKKRMNLTRYSEKENAEKILKIEKRDEMIEENIQMEEGEDSIKSESSNTIEAHIETIQIYVDVQTDNI
ncbi:hypothetical protein PRIPAC_77835 [Pristionchus pacificus]|uniref:Uncharacterized protein n=1 Tax=Pristionchus pacificus TaxID=54126 RepID=A0A2A6BE86_PRIPA|nr:hypothetical protein PRIPAC_77835 [Pristionchus pacificus]|eukprot:PDM64178.1 hypothetical protein PRIPAC_54422 [Pristionchus pacificus]